MSGATLLIHEVVAEMVRTEENIAHPTFEDYLADVQRRLEFIAEHGETS